LRSPPSFPTRRSSDLTEMGFFITESNRGDFAITLRPHRHRSIDTVMDEIRDKIQSEIAGVDVEFHQVLSDLIGDLEGDPKPVERSEEHTSELQSLRHL